jgi:hypothetical protein
MWGLQGTLDHCFSDRRQMLGRVVAHKQLQVHQRSLICILGYSPPPLASMFAEFLSEFSTGMGETVVKKGVSLTWYPAEIGVGSAKPSGNAGSCGSPGMVSPANSNKTHQHLGSLAKGGWHECPALKAQGKDLATAAQSIIQHCSQSAHHAAPVLRQVKATARRPRIAVSSKFLP